ncbi:MAG: 6-phosphogluconolactonase [Gammaproteobacteria bacterium]|nr:6-phosphogluconolactonase [Gammaproteobacteria bacterium]
MAHQWHVYDTLDQASVAAADELERQINTCLQQQDSCHVILPGGNTPVKCLQLLAEKKLPWQKIHWYLTDERCYPIGHEDRNDSMLQEHFWSRISATNIHRIQADLGPEVAASLYRETIRPISNFDIAFLGMGQDGHTASLFPGNSGLNDQRSVIPVYDSPKQPDERVSLGISTLQKVNFRMVLAAGTDKADIIARIKNHESLPINDLGDITWFIDHAAGAKS